MENPVFGGINPVLSYIHKNNGNKQINGIKIRKKFKNGLYINIGCG